MAFGTFDHFHAGHESYLRQAKSLGDELVVIIARDETVEHIKGRKPDFTEKQRKDAVKASDIADTVVIGKKDDKYAVVKKYKPDIIAFGYDQFAFTYRLKKFLIDEKINAKIVRMQSFKPRLYKTSIIRSHE